MPLSITFLILPDDSVVLFVGVDDEGEDAVPQELLAAGRPLYQPAHDGPHPQPVALQGGHHVQLSLNEIQKKPDIKLQLNCM